MLIAIINSDKKSNFSLEAVRLHIYLYLQMKVEYYQSINVVVHSSNVLEMSNTINL